MKKQNNSKEYVKIHKAGWTGYVLAEFQHIPLDLLVEPDSTEKLRSPFEKVSSSDTAEVYRYSINLQEDEKIFYLKKYPHRSLVDAIKHLFRASRANRAFKAGLMLQQHGFHTPQIIAFLQKKAGLFATDDILITQEMPRATDLSSVFDINEICQKPISITTKRLIITELGKTIGQMHSVRILHGDLRAGNVFVSLKSHKPDFIFIDNERTTKYLILPLQLRKKNLVQLNILFYR